MLLPRPSGSAPGELTAQGEVPKEQWGVQQTNRHRSGPRHGCERHSAQCRARRTEGGKVSVVGAFGKGHFRDLGGWGDCLAWWLFFFFNYSEGLLSL